MRKRILLLVLLPVTVIGIVLVTRGMRRGFERQVLPDVSARLSGGGIPVLLPAEHGEVLPGSGALALVATDLEDAGPLYAPRCLRWTYKGYALGPDWRLEWQKHLDPEPGIWLRISYPR
jgi:hypothetical protein